MRLCEPCGYKGDETPATGSRGMDNAPVCDWHLTKTWSYSVAELEEIFYSPNSNLTKHRVEEMVRAGVTAIKAHEEEFQRKIREDDWDPYTGEPRHWITGSDRNEIASRLVIEALIARDVIR